jgi:hypothetical protein
MEGLRGRRTFLGVWRLMDGESLWLVMMGEWGIGRGVGPIGLLRGRECEFDFLRGKLVERLREEEKKEPR